MFIINDATVKGGVLFPETLKKMYRAQAIAQENHLPCIYLVDGGGANLSAGDGSVSQGSAAAFVAGGAQFYNQAIMSSMRIPQISAVLGKCTAGGAYIPAMSDESVIVKGNGTIYLGGPPLVKAATGEIANEQDLGGAAMHTSKSGVADHMAENEEEALLKVRSIVEHLARRPRHVLPMATPEPPAYDPDELLGILPEDNKFPYDIREVIARIVDGSRLHEFKPRYGITLICGFAHIHGFPVGILANNGMLFSESAIKATHFIQVCGQRGIPLVFLHNITGFMVGTMYEQGGIAKDGAKMIMAVSCVPVPKFSVVIGGSHGAGNYAMCGPAFGPRFTFLWPNAKISVMGGPQAAEVITIVKNDQLKREGKPQLTPEAKAKMQDPILKLYETSSSAYDSTKAVWDDGIIDPRDTRDVLAQAISISLNAPFPKNGYGVFRM
jgi:acetyl-CoA carboxylase carboxyltransferase component